MDALIQAGQAKKEEVVQKALMKQRIALDGLFGDIEMYKKQYQEDEVKAENLAHRVIPLHKKRHKQIQLKGKRFLN